MTVSKTCLDFLSKCLCFDFEKRISIDHALNHPFINPDSPQYLEHIDIFHPVEPQLLKQFQKVSIMESRMFNSSQNDFLRAKYLRNACFLNIHEVKFLKNIPKTTQ